MTGPRISADVLTPFVERPGRAALLLDFDGTLSPIVDVPGDARPLAGAGEVLAALARRFAVVAVVSGRPASFLEPLLPAGVVISGLYGLETVRDGVRFPLSTMPGEYVDHVFAGPMERETTHFLEAVAHDRPVLVDPRLARQTMEVYLAADLSAARNEVVELPLKDA